MLKPEHKAALEKYTGSHNGKSFAKGALLKPNPVIAKALIARMASMTPEQAQVIKSIVTPATADALKVLMPELSQLIDKGISNG